MKRRNLSRRLFNRDQKRRSFLSWLRTERPDKPTVRKLRFEHLEDRRVLATVSVSDVTVEEGNAAVFTLTLSDIESQDVVVTYDTTGGTATADVDYNNVSSSATVTIPAGETTATVNVPTIEDNIDESDETFNFNIISATNATVDDGLGVGTITDNDAAPSVTVSDATATEGSPVVFTLTLSNPSGQAVTVRVNTTGGTATANVDYNNIDSFLDVIFAPGATTQTVSVTTFEDNIDELDETFTLDVLSATGTTVADGQGVGTITDNDAAPAISINDVSLNEGDAGTTAFVFTVTLSNPSSQTVTVDFSTLDGSATVAGGDYLANSGAITFAPGATTQTLTVLVNGDFKFEADEQVGINLSAATNSTIADGTAAGTILNDDEGAQGTAGDDLLEIFAGPGSSDGFYQLNGGPPVPFAGINSFRFVGLGGNDIFRINNPAGGLFAPVDGIFYDGGAQTGAPGDSLEILGGAHTSQTHTFAAEGSDGHNGSIALVNGATTASYTYTGLEPILVNAGTPADIVFNLPAGANPGIVLADDAPNVAGISRLSGSTFEDTDFANPTSSLTINGGAAADTVTLSALDAAFNANVIYNSLAGGGTVFLNATTGSTNNYLLNGGSGNELFDVSGAGGLNSLDSITRPVSVVGGGGANDVLEIDDFSGIAADPLITITSTQVTGIAAGIFTYTDLDRLEVDPTDSFVVNVQIDSTAAGAATFLDDTSSLGGDTVTVGNGTLDNILGSLTIQEFGGSPDNLIYNDSADASENTYTLSSDGDLTRTGIPAITIDSSINLFEIVTLNAGTGSDTVTVTPGSGVTFNLDGNLPTTLPGDELIYNGLGTKTLAGPAAGTITAAGVGPVVFIGFERVSATGGNLLLDTINIGTLSDGFATGSDGAPNSLRLTRDVTGLFFQVFFDGNTGDANPPLLISTQLYASIGTITVNGAGDNDTLIVDHGNNLILDRTINFAGAGGSDTLVMTGILSGASSGVYNPGAADPNGFSGQVIHTSAAAQVSTVNFTGLSPVEDLAVLAAYSINAFVGADTINAIDGPLSTVLDPLTGAPQLTYEVNFNGAAELVRFRNKTAVTLNALAGADIITATIANRVDAASTSPFTTFNVNAGDSSDEVRITTQPLGLTYNVDTGLGVPDRIVIGVGSFAVFNTGTGTLASVLGTINVNDNGGVGETYLDNSGDATAGRTFTFNDAASIPVFAVPGIAATSSINGAAINIADQASDIFQFADGSGGSTINVNATADSGGAISDSTFFGNGGDDIFNIDGDGLRDNNTFNGGTGLDTFNVNVSLGQDITADTVQINGDPSPANRRDLVVVSHADPRNFAFNYGAGPGEIDVTGFTTTINIDTVETVRLNGSGQDTALVNGLVGVDDTLTVNPYDTNQILVFRGGNPYDGSVRATHFAQTQLPGVAGGSTSPDLQLRFIAQDGFTVDGQGGDGVGPTDDRLFAYYSSDQALISTAEAAAGENPFGFGPGILMPSFGSSANAVDDIEVFTGGNLISAVRALGTTLVDVNVVLASFVQPDVGQAGPPGDLPGVIVNSGHEAAPTVPDPECDGLRSDSVTVNPAVPFGLSANGGDPLLNPAALRQGDKLVIDANFQVINVFSDKQTPPDVTFQFDPDSGTSFDFQFSGFECIGPLDATQVNLVGDNNEPTVDQTDNFVVRGEDVDGDLDGTNEFNLRINGSPLIPFTNVEFLNVFGFDLRTAPAPTDIPATADLGDDIDTLDICAYADNADNGISGQGGHPPRGWGLDVHFNEGTPNQTDGAQQDLLIFHTSAGGGGGGSVSEDIVVVPSGPDNGEVRDSNAADGSVIVVVQYVGNTDIIFIDDDGSLSDTDTLTLRGSNGASPQVSGNDIFDVDFTRAGDVASPFIVVSDRDRTSLAPPANNILYRVRSITGAAPAAQGFQRISIDGQGGNDVLTVNPGAAGVGAGRREVTVDGGAGNDFINAVVALTELAGLTLRGGAGDDTIFGSRGIDFIEGNDGNDLLVGFVGDDFVQGGNGSDTFVWNPGDGDDEFAGDAGSDELQFNGANGNDVYTLSAVNGRLHFQRQPGNVSVVAAGVEVVNVDAVTVDLSGRNEFPQNATATQGFGNFQFNPVTRTFDVRLFVPNIAPATITDSHIHLNITGSNGPVVVPFGGGALWTAVNGGAERVLTGLTVNDFNGASGLPRFDELLQTLLGRAYFNVHTAAFPGGEIRGQITTASPTAGSGGNDTFILNDLSGTGVTTVTAHLGADREAEVAAFGPDSVIVNGRSVADAIVAERLNTIDDDYRITGLSYAICIFGSDGASATVANRDLLSINGLAGNDDLKAVTGMEAVTRIVLDGGSGDDFLSADAVLIGGLGDDFLEGGAGDDQFFGNDGEDTMVGGTGNDTYDGGPGVDTILVQATAGNDRIDLFQDSSSLLRYNVAGLVGAVGTETDTLIPATVEEVRIVAGAGDDIIRVAHSDALVLAGVAANMLRIAVDGGDAGASDRLTVTDDGAGDTTVQRIGETDTSGTYTMYALVAGVSSPLPPVVYDRVEFTSLNPIDPVTGGTGTGFGGRLFVFKHDPFEANNTRANATFLGANETLNLDPTIDPGGDAAFGLPGDEDWYRVTAAASGTLDFQLYCDQQETLPNGRAGLPGDGNLSLEVRDVSGNLISGFGANDITDDERVRIPAVQGQTYYYRVTGATADAISIYNVSVINTAAPVPFDIELLDAPLNTATNSTPGAPGATAAGLSSDTGRSRFDDITFDNDPTILIRVPNVVLVAGAAFLDDVPANGAAPGSPFDEQILIPFRPAPDNAVNATGSGFRVAVFVTEIGTDNTAPRLAGYAQLEAVPRAGVFTFTFTNDALVPDGSYFLSSSVEMIDPTAPDQNQGFGELAESLEFIVDTILPPATFGGPAAGDGLILSDDCPTIFANLTNVARPTFWGRAEADTVINLYLDSNANGIFDPPGSLVPDVFLGQTVATPFDGGDQYPSGYWEIESRLSLNDPSLVPPLPFDGLRTLFITAEDVAGNITGSPAATVATTFQIVIDTQGPQVTDVDINNAGNPYDLFDPKPSTDGPTPLVNSLVISFQDLPARVAGTLYAALADGSDTAGLITLIGDYNGIIPIRSVVFTPDQNPLTPPVDPQVPGQPARGFITLTFRTPGLDGIFNTVDDVGKPLPDDRFTLTVSDEITDPLCNKLDGESNASEPQENPTFPSGNGVPGGDFVARFTVDSRPEVGTWGAGAAWIDTNGNTIFDQDNADFSNRDIAYYLGFTSDNLFAGNFVKAAGGTADGFDKLAAYGRVGSQWRVLVDVDNDGAITPGVDVAQIQAGASGINGVPVSGNFDGNLLNGDEFGVFTGTSWVFDTNHDWILDPGSAVAWTQHGYPVVGNFDGVAGDDLATYRDNIFSIDFGRNGTIDRTFRFGFPTPNNRPISADVDRDGHDDLGLYVPNRAAAPDNDAEWYILVSAGARIVNRIHADPIDGVPVIDYEAIPFGNDLYTQYGDEFGVPILGNFDPPVTAGGGPSPGFPSSNPRDPLDVNNDGLVSAIDALLVINEINAHGSHALDTSGFHTAPFVDTDQNNIVSPHDVLLIINHLNKPLSGSPGAESESESSAPTAAHDAIFGELGAIALASSSDAGIISLLADEQMRAKRTRRAE